MFGKSRKRFHGVSFMFVLCLGKGEKGFLGLVYNAGGNSALDWYPIQGGVEILLVAFATETGVKRRPDGPPGARFSKAPECFRARKAIFRSSVSKNGEVYTPKTSIMKGTSVHL